MSRHVPKVAIIILHWRGLKDTLECLASLEHVRYPDWELLLVLNGTSADDCACLSEQGRVRGRVIHLKQNLGFAGGCNVGMKTALSNQSVDYVLLLNNDTIVDPDFLTHLVHRAESDPSIGIVGAKTYYYGSHMLQFTRGDISLWKGRTFNRGSGEEDHGQFDQSGATQYVHGACLLMKRDAVERVGLFDEAFFAYWEETDLCLRARARGLTVFYESSAILWHKVSRSSPSPSVLYYLLRNNIYFMKKHARPSHWLTFLPCFMLMTTPLQAAKPFLHDPWTTGRAIVSAYRDGFRMQSRHRSRYERLMPAPVNPSPIQVTTERDEQ